MRDSEDIIKMDLKEMGWDVALINLVQDTSPRWYQVDTV